MLAARLYEKNDMRIEEVSVPEIGEGEVLLRVKAASVCGTDLRMYKNGAGISPLTLCHEFSGVIEKAGSRAAGLGFTDGTRIAVAPNIGCGFCDLCVSGKSHHCPELTAIGVHMDGGFAEYVKIPERAVRLGNVIPIEENISFKAAAANEAFSCVYGAFERYGVNPGEVVVIIGAGAIGFMHATLAKMAGAAKIILNDLSEERLQVCSALDPSIIIAKDDLRGHVMAETGNRGADVVITACSVAEAQQMSFGLCALDGRVNFFGGLPKGKEIVGLDTNIIHYKQLTVTGTTRAAHAHYRKTLGFISSGLVDADSLVTHSYTLRDIGKAFANAEMVIGLKQCIEF